MPSAAMRRSAVFVGMKADVVASRSLDFLKVAVIVPAFSSWEKPVNR